MLLMIELFTTLVSNMIWSLSCEPCGFTVMLHNKRHCFHYNQSHCFDHLQLHLTKLKDLRLDLDLEVKDLNYLSAFILYFILVF